MFFWKKNYLLKIVEGKFVNLKFIFPFFNFALEGAIQ